MKSGKITRYAIGPIGASLLGFLTLPIITWFYTVEDVGRVSMLQVFTSFCILLFCLGLDQAYMREYNSTQNKSLLLKMTLLPGLSLGLIFFIFIYSYDSSIISKWLYEISSPYLSVVTIICFIVALIARYLSLIIRMQERALAFSMSQLLPKLLFLIIILTTVYFNLERDTYNLITANVLSIIFVFFIFSWNTRHDWFFIFNSSVERKKLKKVLAFGLPLMIGGLAFWGLNVADRLFLRMMSSYFELGIYSVAMSVAAVAGILSGIFNTIWAPMVFKWESEGEVDIKKIDEISEFVLAIVYFIVVLSGLFSWIIPYFLPNKYVDVQFLITSCLLGPLFYTLSETTAVGISLTRKTKFSMLASIGAMLINLIGNYMLVPKLGAIGAAASTAVAFWSFFILRTEFSKLVWRKIPFVKSYFCVTLLMICSISSMIFLAENIWAYILMWFVMLLIGFYIFFGKILRLLELIRKHL